MKTLITIFLLSIAISSYSQHREKTTGFTIEDHRIYIHVDTINSRAGATIYMRGCHYANVKLGTLRCFRINLIMYFGSRITFEYSPGQILSVWNRRNEKGKGGYIYHYKIK